MDNYGNTVYAPGQRKRHGGCLLRLIELAVVMFAIWWVNNYFLISSEETIRSKKVQNDIRISVISDLHASTSIFAISNERIVRKVNSFSPDIVCVLGDMHSSNASQEEKNISLDLMKRLVKEQYKVYFVLGEHDDRTNGYISKMKEQGIRVLDQESEKIKVGSTDVTIYGISNAWFSSDFDLSTYFKLDTSTYNILLAHIPMFEAYEKFGADLTLSADTHGGIIRLPFLGPAYMDGRVFPKVFDKSKPVYDKGLFQNKNGYMFITSGIGNYPVPARFLNLPEVGEITVKAAR